MVTKRSSIGELFAYNDQMTADKKPEPVVVEVLPDGWDEQPPVNRAMRKVDMSSPLTWLLIPPALIFAFGLVLWAVGTELQRRAGMLDDQER
jgi:hypothetical protein